MRHGRLTAALTLIACTGLAAAQPATLSKPVPASAEGSPARVRLSSAELPPALIAEAPAPREVGTVPPTESGGSKFAEDQCPPEPAAPAAQSAPAASAVPAAPETRTYTVPSDAPTLPFPTAPYVVADPVYSEGIFPVAAGPRAWLSVEYLAWRIRPDKVPPLGTTGPATFPAGFLDSPTTVVLFDGELRDQTFDGGRVRLGCWLDDCQTLGVEASFFGLCPQSDRETFYSDAFPVLARPFFDVNPGATNSQILAFPGIVTGELSIENESALWGGTLAGRMPLCCGCQCRVDGLVGGMFLNLNERITITETPRVDPAAPFPDLAGAQVIVQDEFKTRNCFYGGFIGFDAQFWSGPCFINLVGSLGVGCTQQTVEATGYQQIFRPDGTFEMRPGGLLVVPDGNLGKETRNAFSLVPQAGVNLGYQLCENVQVFGGYSVLCWTNVVRPGAQIDTAVDINKIPNFGGGPPATDYRPTIPFTQQTFWAQGINAGIRLGW